MFSLFSDPNAPLRIRSFQVAEDGRLLIEVTATDPRELAGAVHALTETKAEQNRSAAMRRRMLRAA